MKYAVINIKGNQYKVEEGKEYLVDKLIEEKPVVETMLIVNDGNVFVGYPNLKNASVKFKILQAQEKGKKIAIQKYKAKSRYRRKYGFRPKYSKLLIEKIIAK